MIFLRLLTLNCLRITDPNSKKCHLMNQPKINSHWTISLIEYCSSRVLLANHKERLHEVCTTVQAMPTTCWLASCTPRGVVVGPQPMAFPNMGNWYHGPFPTSSSSDEVMEEGQAQPQIKRQEPRHEHPKPNQERLGQREERLGQRKEHLSQANPWRFEYATWRPIKGSLVLVVV